MKKIIFDNSWPASWKSSYKYDLLDIYGSQGDHGYAYQYANRFKHTLELVKKVSQPNTKILDLAAAQANTWLMWMVKVVLPTPPF